jgi:hypothetical protein
MKPESLPDLLRSVMRSWGPEPDRPGGSEPPERMVTALMRLLGSKATKVLREVLEDGQHGLQALEQLVIAFGLGWGRRSGSLPWPGSAVGWDGVWDGARRWLEDQVFRCMTRTSHYLEFGLCIEGYAFREHPDLSPMVVQRMVYWLISGKCPCPKLFAKGAGGRRSELRVARCLRDHSIAGWDAEACSFLDFIWQAVKGPKPHRARRMGNFSPKALVQGMHFWNLHQESHLHFADVLVWICRLDGSRNFEGLPCLMCLDNKRGGVFDPGAFRTVDRRLVVPLDYEGRYVKAVYWNCQHCRELAYPGHYYPGHLKTCPKCQRGRGPGTRRSHVFLLGPSGRGGGEVRWPENQADSGSDADEPVLAELPVAGLDGRILEPHTPNPRIALVRAVLDELEPSARRILELRFVEQLTRGEAARAMGLTTEVARRLEAAARKQFKVKMRIEEEGTEDDYE